jgi:hypothetical protein
MIERCRNPKVAFFKHYGGRGISVCERWQTFENFYADMGPMPTARHTVERKDTNGNYEPSNCRWATRREQARNTRTNRRVTFDGKTLCVAEWAEQTGLPAHTIAERLRAGWSVHDALTKPTRKVRQQ